MSAMDPYYQHLHQIASTWLGNNTGRMHVEPSLGAPTLPPPPTGANEESLLPPRNPDAMATGERAVDGAIDEELTNQWKQRMKEARDTSPEGIKRAFVNKMRAAKAGPAAVDKELDKVNTESWKERMRQAKEAKGAPPVDPSQSAEDAVRKALTDMPMTPLIQQAMQEQEMQRVRDHIKSMPGYENIPESAIPQNSNRIPGQEMTHGYPITEWGPPDPNSPLGVQGTPQVGDPFNNAPQEPSWLERFLRGGPVNANLGYVDPKIFPPMVTNPEQRHFPIGIDPNIRSPGKPENPPPVSE